jgi:small basic protein (TIGR04137 family)
VLPQARKTPEREYGAARIALFSVAFPGISSRFFAPMSQHPSLKGKGAIKAKRSVLKRFERVELMKKRGQFKDGQRVIGLPKTKPED